MKEDFLHYIWKNQLFDKADLRTVNNEKVTIINVGEHNTNAGPDFLNAKIKMDDFLLRIHLCKINSYDWSKRHNCWF